MSTVIVRTIKDTRSPRGARWEYAAIDDQGRERFRRECPGPDDCRLRSEL